MASFYSSTSSTSAASADKSWHAVDNWLAHLRHEETMRLIKEGRNDAIWIMNEDYKLPSRIHGGAPLLCSVGNRLIAVSRGRRATSCQQWIVSAGHCQRVPNIGDEDSSPVTALVALNEKCVVLGHENGLVALYTPRDDHIRWWLSQRLRWHVSPIASLAADGLGLASAAGDGIQSWTPDEHIGMVRRTVTQNPTSIVVGADDCLIAAHLRFLSVHRMINGEWKCGNPLAAHEGSITTMSYSHRTLYTGAADGIIKIWSTLQGGFECVWQLHFSSPVRSVRCIWGRIITADAAGNLLLWRQEKDKERRENEIEMRLREKEKERRAGGQQQKYDERNRYGREGWMPFQSPNNNNSYYKSLNTSDDDENSFHFSRFEADRYDFHRSNTDEPPVKQNVVWGWTLDHLLTAHPHPVADIAAEGGGSFFSVSEDGEVKKWNIELHVQPNPAAPPNPVVFVGDDGRVKLKRGTGSWFSE